MKANELRIGNYLQIGCNYISVGIIKEQSISFNIAKDINKYKTWNPYLSINDERINPIPLTEEILLKCGFVRFDRTDKEKGFLLDNKIKSKRIYIRTKVIGANRISNHFFTVFNHSECHIDEIQFITSIDYLHELQNICFLLRKKELEINL